MSWPRAERAERRSLWAIPCSSRSPTMRSIRRTATIGVPGTPMPAFAAERGRHAHRQTDRCHCRPASAPGRSPTSTRATRVSRPYVAQAPGDPTRGAEVYATYCSSCHGPDGRGGQKASSIVDGSYLVPGERSESSNDRDCWASGTGCAGLAQQRARQADVGAGHLRRRRLAGGAAATVSRHQHTRPFRGRRNESNPMSTDQQSYPGARCSSRSACSSTESSVRFWPCRSCVIYVAGDSRAEAGGYLDLARRWADWSSFQQARPGWRRTAIRFRSGWDGQTADIPCWVRNIDGQNFQVFAINCAHLGCPVRWFPQSNLFMCPCHGGVYYQDGSHASGPPPRGLFQYQLQGRGRKTPHQGRRNAYDREPDRVIER